MCTKLPTKVAELSDPINYKKYNIYFSVIF